MDELDLTIPVVRDISIPELVRDLNAQFLQMWWEMDCSLPAFQRSMQAEEQQRSEKQLERLVNGLIFELQHLPGDAAGRAAFQERLRFHGKVLAGSALGLEEPDLSFLEKSGLIDCAQEFARLARRFDPGISGEDIYQAARNVVSMNLVQLLMDLPVEVTPAVLAYSLLYPYSDNYLDDPRISRSVKQDFNTRFRRRLLGEPVRAANRHEEIINELVGMIEGQFDRARYPLVWDSLAAIHAAQARSLKLVAPGASPYEVDVIGITFEKGGTSVLADGFLVAGWLAPEEAAFLYGYGAFTQLVDDLEDVDLDRKEGRLTVFSQTVPHWKLDAVTNRTIHFGRSVFEMARAFRSPAVEPLLRLIDRGLDSLLIDTAAKASRHYSPGYLRELESHTPFRFGAMKKQRAKLERHKVSVARLVDSWI